ncbi:uncharacterized protein LOC111871030 [Cryptotermes secundus]|uniref:uncharacterized protein LOC111871030 n=1 Tax=Cryptotermes secundus TaxID=105785 RepID=UPI001454C4BF|nr:uncharacterized protein LOC111871030 [Cryptotermes secundus]
MIILMIPDFMKTVSHPRGTGYININFESYGGKARPHVGLASPSRGSRFHSVNIFCASSLKLRVSKEKAVGQGMPAPGARKNGQGKSKKKAVGK